MWPWNFHEWHVFHVVHVLHYLHVHGCSWPLTWGTVCHSFCCSYWGAQNFLCLFIISNPCVDPGPLPKKYERKIMELWTGERSNCHFYGFCYKDSRPREFQVSCLWLAHCMFVVDTCGWSSRRVNVTKDAHHEENEITWGPWHLHVLHVANSIPPQTNILWEHCRWLCWMHHRDMPLKLWKEITEHEVKFWRLFSWIFDELLMKFWCSFENCIKMMQFWCSFTWKVMQFCWNCIKTASCFSVENFNIFSSQKMKIWRPNDWLEMNIIVTSKLISCHHFSQVSSAQVSCNATSKSSSALNSKQVSSKSKKCLPVK